jgi:hypothetical protein
MLSDRAVLDGVGEGVGAGALVGTGVPEWADVRVGVGGPTVGVGGPRQPWNNPKAKITANIENRY